MSAIIFFKRAVIGAALISTAVSSYRDGESCIVIIIEKTLN